MFAHSINYVKDREEGQRQHLLHRGAWLKMQLPTNPICWLIGHCARGVVSESKYLPAWTYIYCRVCGQRHSNPLAEKYRRSESVEEMRAREATLVDAFRDPERRRNIEKDTSTREGWGVPEAEWHLEFVVPCRPLAEFSLRLHVGSAGSETPWDAHLTIAGAGVYGSIGGIGRRIANTLTRGSGRDLAVNLYAGVIHWKLWAGEEHDRTPWHTNRRGVKKYQPWRSRDGHVSANLLDYLRGGPARFSYSDRGEQHTAFVRTTEDTEHMVDFQLQLQTRARPRGPRTHSVIAKWRCPEGIPVRNHDWKGDHSYSSAVLIPDDVVKITGARRGEDPDLMWQVVRGEPAWLAPAVEALKAQITRDRKHYEWNPRLPVND